MIQARRDAGSRCGRSSARMIVAASARKMTAELISSQFIGRNAAYCSAAVQRGLSRGSDRPAAASGRRTARRPPIGSAACRCRRRAGPCRLRRSGRRSATGTREGAVLGFLVAALKRGFDIARVELAVAADLDRRCAGQRHRRAIRARGSARPGDLSFRPSSSRLPAGSAGLPPLLDDARRLVVARCSSS